MIINPEASGYPERFSFAGMSVTLFGVPPFDHVVEDLVRAHVR